MIKPRLISGFQEKLPEEQMVEDKFKKIISDCYSKSGFVSIETPIVEREEILISKGGDNNEIYGIHRLNGNSGNDSGLGLRFDLTIPLARYVAMHENNLDYPFKRQQIERVYRGEHAQKGRYREFYQADIDIIGNGKLPIYADIEIISTINNALEELNIGDFTINLNNKKLLFGFLGSIGISEEMINIVIGIIDKKDKIDEDKENYPNTRKLLYGKTLDQAIVDKIVKFLTLGNANANNKNNIFDFFEEFKNDVLLEGILELKTVYNSLINLGVNKNNLQINPSISRGLDYYTGTLFETFMDGYENMGSISSGGRYENLTSNFSRKKYPGVGGCIGLSRLISILNELGRLEVGKKTPTDVLILNMQEEFLEKYLQILSDLRGAGISSELYLDSETKIQKQLKYAEKKGIGTVVIAGENELSRGYVGIKDLKLRAQIEVGIDELINKIKLILINV